MDQQVVQIFLPELNKIKFEYLPELHWISPWVTKPREEEYTPFWWKRTPRIVVMRIFYDTLVKVTLALWLNSILQLLSFSMCNLNLHCIFKSVKTENPGDINILQSGKSYIKCHIPIFHISEIPKIAWLEGSDTRLNSLRSLMWNII